MRLILGMKIWCSVASEGRGLALLFLVLLYSTVFTKDSVESFSKLIPKAGQHMDSVFTFYESISLDPVDESILDESAQDRLAAKDVELPTHLQISALNRTFSLYLHRGEPVFTEDAKIVVHGATPEEFQEMDAAELLTNYVEGFLLDEPQSSVRGHLHDGAFSGTMVTKNASYYVEPADVYFQNASHFDAIIYEEANVKIDLRKGKLSMLSSFCYTDKNSNLSNTYRGKVTTESRWVNATDRSRVGGEAAVAGQVCKLKLVADHWFFKVYSGSNLRKTVAHLEYHVQEADKIFRETDFNGNGVADNVRIKLAKAEVFQSKLDPNYILGDEGLNASAYLEQFSLYNHDGFCGAMAFSSRVYDVDTLGFAYRAGPSTSGGICESRGNFGGTMKNLNVGMITMSFKGAIMPKARSTVVFTHELGHMFGSPHDESSGGSECYSTDRKKHYLMSAIANLGVTSTNRKFSPCSIRAIYENMQVHGQCLNCVGKECGAGLGAGSRTIVVYSIWILIVPAQAAKFLIF